MRAAFITRYGICFFLTFSLWSCNSNSSTHHTDQVVAETTIDSPYHSKTIFVNGIHINYLDWQGNGPTLVMVHGLGCSPHNFDDLAMVLKNQFHIIAYARRGHGHTDAKDPYDINTLTEDLKLLLDSLHIAKASLLGWSMGGDEITMFAGLYPEHVNKLVYLEAGYDWSDGPFCKSFGKMLSINTPDSADMSSIDSFKNWYHTAWIGKEYKWTPSLEAYILDVSRPDSTGHVNTVPNPHAAGQLIQTLSSSQRDYKKVKAPALAIYSSRFFPADVGRPKVNAAINEWEQKMVIPFRKKSMQRMQTELQNATIIQIPNTTHMSIGTYQTDSLASIISRFLTSSN